MNRPRKHPGPAPPRDSPEYRDWWIDMYCPYLLPAEPEREKTLAEVIQEWHEAALRGIRILDERCGDEPEQTNDGIPESLKPRLLEFQRPDVEEE